MTTLTIRTDKPEAEIGLFDGSAQLAYETWQAHRELAETIHVKIAALLQAYGKELQDVQGIVCFKGPGSFTGLRIGLTVANALAYSLDASIVASLGENWLQDGLGKLMSGANEHVALPEYGAPAHTTAQRR
ncbi:MAG: tRNA (adenosine(37)-N6)-threonylcarbamoyltransferase complex dimerization subunit type 1 TsaB [Candidatus Micrarchaeaceae archaeon]